MTLSDLLTINGLTAFRDFAYKFVDIREILENDATFVTVFAPTNGAMFALPSEEISKMRDDDKYLRQVLKHHIAPGDVTVTSVGFKEIQTMAKYPIIIRSFENVRIYFCI